MAHTEARAWWADVQHLRDGYERTDEARRRADEADLASRRAIRERRGVEAEVSSMLAGPRHAPVAPRRTSGPEPGQRRTAGPELGQRHTTGPDVASRRVFESDLMPPLGPEPAVAPWPGGQAGAIDQAAAHRGPRVKGSGTPGRRTVEIRGRTVPAPMVPRPVETDRRRPQRRPLDRVGTRPDRVAMWALLMCLLLILVAIGTADTPALVALTLR